MASLPVDGQTDWGDTLNVYLTALSGQATSTQTGLQNHAANSPADPHGDRAYAQSLVGPFTTGLNAPNGLVKLNGSGTIPPALITAAASIGGMYSAVVDAVSMFGMIAGTNTDQSSSLQQALNYVSNLGGGIVYIGPGTFSIANSVYVGPNTWIIMSNGTVIQRIPGSPNTPYMFTNIHLVNTSTPANNVRISGGTLNAVGSFTMGTACTVIEFFQGSGHIVEDVIFITPTGNSHAVEFNGVARGYVNNCLFNGTPSNSPNTNSCILLSSSTSANSPSGINPTLYTGQGCFGILVNDNGVQLPPGGFTYSAYGCLVGSDAPVSSAVTVQGLTVTGCFFGAPAPNGPIYQASATWTQAVFSGNTWGQGKGTSTSPSINTSIPYDVWILCSLQSGWSNDPGNYPLQFRISQDGMLTLFGMIDVNSSSPTSTITQLPYHPIHQAYAPAAFTANDTTAIFVNIGTDGRVVLQNVVSGIAGQNLFINATFPVDYAGNGLLT